MEDSAIIDLYWAREERALSETDTKYGGYCRSIAHNILKNREDSEECVSDTWLHAWNAMPPQRPGVLSAFLGRITRNLSFDRFKAAHADKRGGGEYCTSLEELGDIPVGDDSPELGEAIEYFLGRLSRSDRMLFMGRYYAFEPVGELAARLGISPGAASLRLSRMRNKLRALLTKRGITI